MLANFIVSLLMTLFLNRMLSFAETSKIFLILVRLIVSSFDKNLSMCTLKLSEQHTFVFIINLITPNDYK